MNWNKNNSQVLTFQLQDIINQSNFIKKVNLKCSIYDIEYSNQDSIQIDGCE